MYRITPSSPVVQRSAEVSGVTHPARLAVVRAWLVGVLAMVAVLLVATTHTVRVEAAGPPDVNGLFYGDDDYREYVVVNTSEYGSKLYLYFDNPTVYVALVVDRSVNDNVFARKQDEPDYMADAGWSGRHDAAQLINAEYAEFTLRCGDPSASWTWQQGYGRLEGGIWVSDEGGSGSGTPPPSYSSSSSLAWNLNTWNSATVKPWDMHVNGTDIGEWKSPFDPAAPNSVVGLEGYPASGPLTFSSRYQFEWPMVYEWSVDLQTAGCGDGPLYLVTGLSYNSPLKSDGEDESDSFFIPPIGEQEPFYDFGDLPDTYGTTKAGNGAAHIITIGGAHLGSPPDMDLDGQPTPGADADDATASGDEDGLTRQNLSMWEPGDSVGINFDVRGAPATADIALWIDWNRDGDFGDVGEYYSFPDRPTGVVATESIVVPEVYAKGAPLSVRTRIFNDEADAPGGTLDAGDYLGVAATGEVEDFRWDFSPTAVTLARTVGRRGSSLPFTGGLLLLSLGSVVLLKTLLAGRRSLIATESLGR